MKPEKVYQFRIALDYIRPLIWRRFLVTDDVTFAKLHKIIQIVMGWEDYHLYDFLIGENRYSEPDDEWHDIVIKDDKKFRLRDLNLLEKQTFSYTYDFGDNWLHEIEIEEIFPVEAGLKYPKCMDGARACPPEDCSGPHGYETLVALTRLPIDTLYGDDLDRVNWVGEDHDFEYFSVDEVNFLLWKRFFKINKSDSDKVGSAASFFEAH
jgi:hypothetical protein